jgi:protein-disulfide isomerase
MKYAMLSAAFLAGAVLAGGAVWLAAPKPAVTESAPEPAPEADDIAQRVAARWPLLAEDAASPAIGPARASVTIVEFFDYACPYCKAAEPRLAALLAADPDLRLVPIEFPILTPQSLVASRAALAAMRQGKYAPFHQRLMQREGQLSEDGIFETAQAVGLDMARLKRDMADPAIADRLIANFNLARGIRAFQTPTFIVNGKVLGSDSAALDFSAEVAAARRK